MSIGHEDWQGYAVWRGSPIAAATVNVTSVLPYVVDAVVTNFASIFFGIGLNSGIGVTVTASWYTDSTKAIRIAQKQWVLNAGNFLNQNIPSLANFLEVVISTGQAGTQNVFVSIAPNNIPTPKVTSPRGVANNGGVGTVVANAAQPSFPIAEVMDGDGILAVTCSVVNANLGLFVDFQAEGGGVPFHLSEGTGQTTQQTFEFKAVGQPTVFTVHNFTGAAVNIDWSLSIQPN